MGGHNERGHHEGKSAEHYDHAGHDAGEGGGAHHEHGDTLPIIGVCIAAIVVFVWRLGLPFGAVLADVPDGDSK